MMDKLRLKSPSEMSVIGMASILMIPSGSASLNRAAINDDFPAPVLPTTPTWEKTNEWYSYNSFRWIEMKVKGQNRKVVAVY